MPTAMSRAHALLCNTRRMHSQGGLRGIGYEGATQAQVVEQLVADNVSILVDVRLTPLSRRPGLSKRKLGLALESEGITYMHVRSLGNPKDNRAGFADAVGLAGRRSRNHFRELLRSSEAAQAAIDDIAFLSMKLRVALLCFEGDERFCHRQLVMQEIERRALKHQKSGSAPASLAFG